MVTVGTNSRSVEDAIQLAEKIGRTVVFVTSSTWTVFARREAVRKGGRVEEANRLDETISETVPHDLENIARLCNARDCLVAFLVHDNELTPLARDLATHSAGSRRRVGKYMLYPAKSSLAAMVWDIHNWIAGVANAVFFETITLQIDSEGDEELLGVLSPDYWRSLVKRIEELPHETKRSVCVAIARHLQTHPAQDVADDAIEELLTYRASQPPEDGDKKPKTSGNRRSRPKSDSVADAALWDAWVICRDDGCRKVDFASDQGLTEKQAQNAFDRDKHRRPNRPK